MVLPPRRDSAEAVGAVLGWGAERDVTVLGIGGEIERLRCTAVAVPAEELAGRSDLLVSLGGDGTMRLADGRAAPVLGVNPGRLGFLTEVDMPELAAALSAIDRNEYTVEPRLAVDARIGAVTVSAFNDVAVVRVPGHGGSAAVALRATGGRSSATPRTPSSYRPRRG